MPACLIGYILATGRNSLAANPFASYSGYPGSQRQDSKLPFLSLRPGCAGSQVYIYSGPTHILKHNQHCSDHIPWKNNTEKTSHSHLLESSIHSSSYNPTTSYPTIPGLHSQRKSNITMVAYTSTLIAALASLSSVYAVTLVSPSDLLASSSVLTLYSSTSTQAVSCTKTPAPICKPFAKATQP